MLALWQVLSLSLEHRSGIGPATNEGIVQEGAESQVLIPYQSGLHDGLVFEDMWVYERGYRWGKLPENDARSPHAVEHAAGRYP
jgi:hypothetical protein